MQLSLGQKVSGFVIMPIVAFAIVSFFSMKQNLHEKKQAQAIKQNTDFFLAASALIHEVQKERGKSAMLLASKISSAELDIQRTAADQKMERYLETSGHVNFDSEGRSLVQGVVTAVRAVRSEVNEKGNASSVTSQYTAIIRKLINLQVAVTKLARLNGIETRLLSLTMLESAKESSGRLRATLTNILGADNALVQGQLALIESFKAGIEANLESPSLLISREGRLGIERFNTSDDWKKVIGVYETVVSLASQGKYGQDPSVFFAAISRAIDNLGSIVAQELIPISEDAANAESSARRQFIMLLAAVIVVSGLLISVTWLFVRSLSKGLEGISDDLTTRANEIASAAGQISASTQELTASATEQAAAIQQTASSVDEVNSMVAKNAENASKSQAVSNASNQTAIKGKEAVNQMIFSIEEINQSNTDIIHQIEASNREISEIVKVIIEIGNKTKIINDIVFQTKLLSFNASVEAARAGEHGKGFAVVAEEVGNLAQMSGNAAKEISQMLDASVQKVECIVNDTKSRVDNLVRIGKEKVEYGTVTARKCGEVLDEIVKNVEDVTRMISEIASASNEQSRGVQEISKAMGQLDQVTHENTTASQQSADAAATLSSQAESLRAAANILLKTVRGKVEGESKTATRPHGARPVSGNDKGKLIHLFRDSTKDNEIRLPSKHPRANGSNSIPDSDDRRFSEV